MRPVNFRYRGSSRDEWVIVEWPTKKRDLVNMLSILCPSQFVKAGRYVNLHWAGREHSALVVAVSNDRQRLESMMKRPRSPVAGPSRSRKMEEIDGDYSSSASSWKPSDDDTTSSADSDEDIQAIRKHKIIAKKRRLLNRHSMNNLVTPKHRSPPIESRSESSLKSLHRKNVKSQDGRINKGCTDSSLPALARNISAERKNQNIQPITRADYLYRIENLLTSFECLLHSIMERRNNMSPKARRLEESPQATQWHKSPEAREEWHEPPDAPEWHEPPETQQWRESLEAPQRHESSELSKSSESLDAQAYNRKQQRKHMNGFLDEAQAGPSRPVESTEEDHEDEFDRSDDEVLISNKFSKVLNKEIHRMKRDKNINLKTIEKSIKRLADELKISKAITEFKANEENENNITTIQPIQKLDKEWIGIGTGKTLVHKDKFKNVNWKSYSIATRTLLLAVFPRRILATHSLTGKKSPAFLHKPAKLCLDPQTVADVIYEIMDKFGVEESLVRATITTKCSDEAKMLKMRHDKREDDENIPPPPNADGNA
ncbi:protein insensitive-like [Spodoptera litura]|uniref:Protein insensitive-like n=1 Tax=Spodoptera litura TaxID=69820 RepID=A0A9J7E2M4_SPOLT|nr:protein insensitive-like [Spodoptera litura]